MAEMSKEAVESYAYFATQMSIHLVRGLVNIGVSPEPLKSNIRKTLAEGIEQFSLAHREQLENLAKAFEDAVDEGLRQRPM